MRTTRAGTPMTVAKSGTSSRTTAPAPTIAYRPDLQALDHVGPEPDKGPCPDPHATRQLHARPDVDSLSDLALVVDDGGRVDDDGVLQPGLRDDRRLRADDDVHAQFDGGGDERGWMDGVDELKPLFPAAGRRISGGRGCRRCRRSRA